MFKVNLIDFEKGVKNTLKQFDRDVKKSLKTSTNKLLREVNRVTPIDTGRLVKDNKVVDKMKGPKYQIKIKNEVFYGIFLEEGTKRIKPRKFYERSLDKLAPEILSDLSRNI